MAVKGKPQLPHEIQMMLPSHIVYHITTFVPPYEKVKERSPSLQSALRKIQLTSSKGASPTYMMDLEDYLWEDDFVLDR